MPDTTPDIEQPELNRRQRRSQAAGVDVAEVLRRLHSLPNEALLSPEEAAIYMNTRLDLLRSWRWLGKGPGFVGRSHFVRYPKGEIDRFLAGYGRGEAA